MNSFRMTLIKTHFRSHVCDYLMTCGYVPGLRHVGVTKVLFIKCTATVEVYIYTLLGARQWRFLAYA